MQQVDILRQPYQRGRNPIPIRPTLVVGLGDFGREACEQLAARLMLTEESLHTEGFIGPLLVRQEQGEALLGIVRIMHMDWNRWFRENWACDKLMQDISIPNPSAAETGTPPQQRERERDPDDWQEARKALKNPLMLDIIKTVSLPLCFHDMPMHKGCRTQEPNKNFKMRVVVICALREVASAELGPDIIQLLGKIYVLQKKVTKGIQVFTYVGGTSWEEHCKAYTEMFGDDPEDSTKFDSLLEAELKRILPACKRSVPWQPAQGNFLDKLEHLWCNEFPQANEPQQVIETCYLIDSQLANGVIAVQQRPDEPDEAVVAIALAINMFIASNSDRTVRLAHASYWDLENQRGNPGLFATIGVASYSLDHPRIRRMVYNYVVGAFLQRVQPMVAGDDPMAHLLGDNKQRVVDKDFEADITSGILQLCNDYTKRIAFKMVRSRVPSMKIALSGFKYKSAINTLSEYPIIDLDSGSLLEVITGKPISDPREMSVVLYKHIVKQRQNYQEQLTEAFQELNKPLFQFDKAPLIYLYRFQKKSLEILDEEANIAHAPPVQGDADSEQRIFAEAENVATVLFNRLSECAGAIRDEMINRPSSVSGMMGITTRSLLIAPVLILLYFILSQVVNSTTLLASFGRAFALFPDNLRWVGLPIWMASALVALLTWIVLFLGFQWHYHHNLRKQLNLSFQSLETIVQELDKEAWRWALTRERKQRESNMMYLETLCKPRGTISALRDKLLAEKFVARDRVLERIFFDEQIQIDLKNLGKEHADSEKLWVQRSRILQELVSVRMNERELEQWLRERAGETYNDDSSQIIDIVERRLAYQTVQRLEEIWQELSNAAVLFLQRPATIQDDPAIDIEMFGVHNQELLSELGIVLHGSGIEMLSSSDRLRWLFMHVQIGLRLPNIKFTMESQIPS